MGARRLSFCTANRDCYDDALSPHANRHENADTPGADVYTDAATNQHAGTDTSRYTRTTPDQSASPDT